MSGGNKREILNTRERVISDDHNRLQRFIAGDAAQRARFIHSVAASRDYYGGPLATVGTVGNPLEAHILEGIMVIPQSGFSYVHVTAGTGWVVDPDGVTGSSDPSPANPDDNELKYVDTLGVSDTSLTHPANAGPGIRIDVIEFQRTEVVVESDSRDIFNTGSGTFSPVSVAKVSKGDLTFRIRSGTPGSGFPGTVQGWTPIAVASVPAAFTDTDDITYWDVRPLVSDRVFPGFNIVQSNPPFRRYEAWVNESSAGVASNLHGIIEGSIGAYRAGGTIRGSVPGVSDFEVINVLDSASYGDGFPPGANAQFFVWALFPHGLPRWARYAETSPPRFPGPFNGIAVVSLFPPAGYSHNTPSVALPPPASTGLGGTTTSALCLIGLRTHPSAGPVAVRATSAMKGVVRFASLNGKALAAASYTDTIQERYIMTPNIEYPANARAVYVYFSSSFVGVAGVDASYTPQPFVLDPSEPIATANPIYVDHGNQQTPFVIPASTTGTFNYTARIPLRPEWGATAYGPLGVQHIGITWTPVACLMGAPSSATIVGWEY